jgi:hypothetical protein
MLNVIMLSVVFFYLYAERHFVECHSTECLMMNVIMLSVVFYLFLC